MCGDTDTQMNTRNGGMCTWFTPSVKMSPTAKISTMKKYNSKQKSSHLKKTQIMNTLRGVKNAISVTQPVTLYLALELYVEV